MGTLEYIDHYFGGKYNIEISPQGHSFLTLVVAFLLVSRVNIGLGRYNQARDHLGAMYRESRELIQSACVFSNHDHSEAAVQWRHQVALHTILLLRLAMAVIDYPIEGVPAWAIPEMQTDMSKEILTDIRASIFVPGSTASAFSHEPRSEWEETMRVPIRMCYLLRKVVHSQGVVLETPMQLAQENQILGSINGFMR